MRGLALAAALLMMIAGPAQAGHRFPRGARSCLVEVLYSEELPLAPLFYHTLKATLLVTPPDAPPFETTISEVIPWQTPPPRQGQRVRVQCNPAVLNSPFGLF